VGIQQASREGELSDMTDATSTPGGDRARGEGKIGRGTGDDPAGSHSPLVTPTETEAPDRVPAAGRATGKPGGGSVAGRDRTSGPGREAERGSGFGREAERGRGTGSDTVGGVGTGVGGSSGGEGVEGVEGGGGGVRHQGREARLLPHEESDKLSLRLQQAVAGLVDEPRSAVEEADHVLEEVAARFTDAVKQRRRTLRNSWQTGDGGQDKDKAVSAGDTEQLRLALRDYRELAERLLHS
jgi:hypothetical protein